MTWKAAERELVITRVFDAPRDLVWKAWTDRDRTQQWWGPRDFTVPELEIDTRATRLHPHLGRRGARQRTEMTFHKGPFRSAKGQKGEEEGWNQAFDRLEALVEER
jgi:uncharacterized protein YndB with AHSA1/START domain